MSYMPISRRKAKPAGQLPIRSIRLPDNIWAKLDDWRRQQHDVPTRGESIRRLLDFALFLSPQLERPVGKKGRRKE